MASSGTETLVRTIFDQWRETNVSTMGKDDAWEVFVSWLLLKEYNVTLDDVQDGVVDGGNDAGIDSVYTLLEDTLLQHDSDIVEKNDVAKEYREGLNLELHIVQAKNRNAFSQNEVTKLQSILPQALDLSQELSELKREIREETRERLEIFRQTLTNLLTRRPNLSIKVWFASRGLTDNINPNVTDRAKRLRRNLEEVLPNARVNVEFTGAGELWKTYDSRSPDTLDLHCDEIMTSGESYVALAPLENYISLICEPGSDFSVRRHLFDANVRDHQGNVAVNKEIMSTLEDQSSPEFWWMNNGVTILCDEAHSVGKRFALKNIQIVNGLQTSYTIASWFKKINELDGDSQPLQEARNRKILVRIIVADNDIVRDRIIRATNRQTPVADASLRATDRIQRQIERYFESNDLFYDRRKGYYRNLGKDPGKIISISYLGQAMYAIAYGKPEVARGKPNSLLAEEARYKQAFDPGAGLQIFYWVAQVLRSADAHLQSVSQARYPERRYLAPFVAYAAVTKELGYASNHWNKLSNLVESGRKFSGDEIEEAARLVKDSLDRFTEVNSTTAADATKRQAFTQHLAEDLTK
ncbi:hypothetical protein FHR84_000528 [Actinopolyspora biskrensis]|uniref:Abortive phage infection protein C-terminal domain-containing protein n=1 Tax=Actinopolyspora biskrensis TaxID=1470178 RepID=A0A852YPL0_9ACTN|nr:AIPR family protein [Actinopolyspora biskrensis]NYH77214.1 hypothetical protein [Actinopolyspora biskrensis]